MRVVLIMGFLSFLTSCKGKSTCRETAQTSLTIDLQTFQLGKTILGEFPTETDFFANSLLVSNVFEDAKNGIYLETKDGVLDNVFLTIEDFRGRFLFATAPLEIGLKSTEATIRERFGDPYWIDRSDGETILFYEYAEGTIELQFEFPDARCLGFVTLSRDGILSTEEQRKMYGVDKSWPPN